MFKLKNYNVCVLYIFFLISIIQCHLLEGEKCFHQQSMSAGTCKPLDNCVEAAIKNYEKNRTPQLCNLNNKTIVCCPIETQETNEIDILETIEETREIKIVKSEITSENTTNINNKALHTTNGLSRNLCLYYANLTYDIRNPVVNAPGAESKTETQCDLESYTALIIGGSKAKAKEFPHMALIGFGPEENIDWMCGGSLITEQWVLTAAHCAFTEGFGEAKFVRLGELDMENENDDSEHQDFKIIKIVKYPKYEKYFYDDIALFKLDKNARLTAYVRPACLWTKKEIESSKAIATGWGFNSDLSKSQSSNLMKVTLSLTSQSECEQIHQLKIDYKKSFCASGKNDTTNYIQNTCRNDSGGPLQIYAKDVHCMYYIIGVIAYGRACDTGASGIYTRVSNYIPWIEKIVST